MTNEVLKAPLTVEQMRKMAKDNDGYVEGIVAVYSSNMIGRNLEDFLDDISELLTGTEILMNIDYTVVGGSDGVVYMKVSGDASAILEEEA